METLLLQAARAASVWFEWMTAASWQVALFAGIIWLITRLLRRQSASLRYALWLLVFVKLVLPPTLSSPVSASTAVRHFVDVPATSPVPAEQALESSQEAQPAAARWLAGTSLGSRLDSGRVSPFLLLASVWTAGFCLLALFLIIQSGRYIRRTVCDAVPAHKSIVSLVDKLCERMEIGRNPAVLISPHEGIPAVVGMWRPRIVIPRSLVDELSDSQLSNLIGHELAHIKRHDVQVQWIISLLLCCYWFHPVVWLANVYLRREREMACDDTVLYATRQEGRDYSATILRVAEFFNNRVPVGASSLGMLELSENLLFRVRSILDGTRARRSGWRSLVLVVLFMTVIMPMGVWSSNAKADTASTRKTADMTVPEVTSSTPAHLSKEVDPALDKILVTFNHDMGDGFSWTGGPPYFPQTTGKATWVDKRTCALPVKLEEGKFYRVGVNADSFQNFRGTNGIPAELQVIAFTTQGADASLVAALDSPKVVSLVPAQGASDVSPTLTRLEVTFDREMGPGFSWTGGGESFPETTGKPEWSEDKRTCSLPVRLKPAWTYSFGLNSPSFNSFQSAYGIPLNPVTWYFGTADK